MNISSLTENIPNCFPKCENCKKNFEAFTIRTNLHGFRYITDSKLSRFERFIWTSVIFACILICIYYIFIAWQYWNERRVVLNFDSKTTHISQIPFPAITICPETKIRQTIFDSSKMLNPENLSQEEKSKMEKLAQVCDDVIFSDLDNNFENESIIDFLKNVSMPFEELFYFCKWNRKIYDCEKIFDPIVTEQGFCFSFNYFRANEIFKKLNLQNRLHLRKSEGNHSDWSMRTGYIEGSKSETYPRRAPLSGLNNGLSIVLGSNKADLDKFCGGSFQGFRVAMNSPNNIPSITEDYIMLPLSRQMIVAVKPEMIYTPIHLENLPPEKRGCYSSLERELKFFKYYSQKNCEMECIANYTFSVCGCVSFWMPREKSMPICGATKLNCVKEAKVIQEEKEYYNELKSGGKLGICNCYMGCTSIEYEKSTSQTNIAAEEAVKMFKLPKNPKDVEVSVISIYMRRSHFIPLKRIESSTTINFLGNAGGVLSLFIGFSILTFMEIIEFTLIRPSLNYFNERTKNQESEENESSASSSSD